ncbi:MAG TPA: hypothetical protein VNN76_08720 [Bacteroidota bacterium]|nr:hypothetical protein [Bacteroidota bacterium]
MKLELLIGFLLPAFLSFAVTPLVIAIAHRIGAIDLPNERKIHKHPMPRLGGLGIYFSMFLSLLAFSLLAPNIVPLGSLSSSKVILFTAAVTLMLAVGIVDDLKPLSPFPKLIVQVIAATMVYGGGFRISTVTDVVGLEPMSIGLLDFPVTLLWIVGVTNAFNLIDGLDGLAAGVGIIAATTIAAVSIMNSDPASAFMVLVLAGALAGFLPYNFNPARIFLGDSGSLATGFCLAVFSIESSTKGSTAFAILVPVFALGLPLMDTVLSMARRFLSSLISTNGENGSILKKLSSMFLPDRRHIHHQLVALGLSHKNVVLLLYLISCSFGVGAFIITTANNLGASLVLVCIGVATIVGVRQLQYREMAILRNGMLLPIYDTPLVRRRLFQGFLDLAFIAISFVGAQAVFTLTEGNHHAFRYRDVLPLVCGLKLSMFSLFGLYKGTFHLVGIGDLLRVIKAVLLTSLLSGIILNVLPTTAGIISLPMLILDTYFMLSLVVLLRVSFPVLNYLFKREIQGDKQVLIYGAGNDGLLALQQMLSAPSMRRTPVGFLDDAAELEGKMVNGYPVFGSHWRLPSLLKKRQVDEIVIASENLKPENLHRLQQLASQYGIVLKRPRVTLEDFSFERKKHGHHRVPRNETVLA